MALVAAERIERPPLLFGPREDAAALARGVGDGPTLDDAIVGVWEGLVAHAVMACPLCGGGMRPRSGSGAVAIGGCCGDCGTTLA